MGNGLVGAHIVIVTDPTHASKVFRRRFLPNIHLFFESQVIRNNVDEYIVDSRDGYLKC
jgi:hypothetical protein